MGCRLVFYLFFILLMPLQVLEAKELSFSELKELINNQNELVDASRFQVLSNEAKTGHFNRSLIPAIDVDLGYETYRSHQGDLNESLSAPYWQVEMEWNLYRAGRDHYRDLELRAEVEKSSLEKEQLISRMLYQSEVLYWTIIKLRKDSKKISALLVDLEKHRQEVRRRISNKVLRRADLLKVDLSISRLKGLLEKNTLEVDEASNRLVLLLGIEDHKTLKLSNDFPRSWPEVPLKNPQEMIPLNIKMAQADKNLIDYKKLQKKRVLLPEVDLFAVYGRPSASDEYDIATRKAQESALGLRLKWSFGQLSENRAMSNSLSAQTSSLSRRLDYQLRENKALLHEVEHDIKTLSSLIKRSASEISLADEAHSLVLTDFAAGLKTNEEVIGSFMDRLEADLSSTEYQARYLIQLSKMSWINR
jgi:outer membrane protein TolC